MLSNDYANGVWLENGEILEPEKISKLTDYIIDKFAEEKLSVQKATVILENAEKIIATSSVIIKKL